MRRASEVRRAAVWGRLFFWVLGGGYEPGSGIPCKTTIRWPSCISCSVLYLLVVVGIACSKISAWIWAITLGVVLGGLAIVYETHFICAAWPVWWQSVEGYSRWVSGRVLVAALAVVEIARTLACTQGGPACDLARRITGRVAAEVPKMLPAAPEPTS